VVEDHGLLVLALMHLGHGEVVVHNHHHGVVQAVHLCDSRTGLFYVYYMVIMCMLCVYYMK
jgi:hypothetical protein